MNESFLVFTADKIKMLYARNKSDEEIAQELDIPISVVKDVLMQCRLPIKITGITAGSVPLIRVMKGNVWPKDWEIFDYE